MLPKKWTSIHTLIIQCSSIRSSSFTLWTSNSIHITHQSHLTYRPQLWRGIEPNQNFSFVWVCVCVSVSVCVKKPNNIIWLACLNLSIWINLQSGWNGRLILSSNLTTIVVQDRNHTPSNGIAHLSHSYR